MLPKVSVVMLVYNGEKYIKEAIESILNQTFRDFELLIINDGSTDNSIGIINEFKDSRIRILHNEGNKGLVYSRNMSVSVAKGEFIAVMDCDDISQKKRLEKQLNFLEENPEFAVVGSLVQSINKEGKPIGEAWSLYASPEKIKAIMLFRNFIANPASMIRKEILRQNSYENLYPPAEDYALWVRIIENYKVWNIPEILLYYRVHDLNISSLRIAQRFEAEKKLIRRQLEQLLPVFSEEELILHHSISVEGVKFSRNQINQLKLWLSKLEQANSKINKYNPQYFKEVLAEEFYIACKGHSSHLGFWIIYKFYTSLYLKYINVKFKKHFWFIVKSVLSQFKITV